MRYRSNPFDFEGKTSSTSLPFYSPVSIVGMFVLILGFWHVSVSQAQFPASAVQPAVYFAEPGTTTFVPTEISPSSYVMNGPSSYTEGSYINVATAPVASTTTLVSDPRNWALDVANAQMNLDPNRLPDILTARQRLDQAMMELENFLSTSPQHQANWLAFLTWNDLRKELQEESPGQDKLTQIEKTFRQNHFGLEMRQFTNVRDSLAAYTTALRFSTNRANTVQIFSNRLSKLSEQLQLPNAPQNFEGTREIGQTIAYLMQGNQANSLVSAVRSQYSRSNARVLISSEFVNARFSKPVNEANPVNELILGTQLYGQSWTQGWVTPQLLDSSSQAALRLNLSGSFSSQNIGYNRSVKLHTQGAGNVTATETIALTNNGLIPLNDTTSDATLSSQIDSIEAKLRIVRKIASKQAAKQKPEADSIAEGRLETRIRNQFHERLSQQISEANQRIQNPDLSVLARLGIERPNRITWSSPQYLALLWKLQGQTQLAAPISCPLVVDPTGVTIQLHESVITNLLDPVLAGRTLRNSELDTLAPQFGGVLGGGLRKQKDEKPWAITMAPYHPVEIQLDDSLVTFRIRTTRLDSGDQGVDKPASIEASYKITVIDGAIQLERQGDVKIVFAEQRGSRAATMRGALKKIFDDLFKQKLLDEPVRITDRLPSDLQLALSSIQVDDGWIQAHLR